MQINDNIRFHQQLVQLTATVENENFSLNCVLVLEKKYFVVFQSFRIPGYCQPWPDTGILQPPHSDNTDQNRKLLQYFSPLQ